MTCLPAGRYCRKEMETSQPACRQAGLFQYKAYITARVPRIKTAEGVKTAEVPWARPDSGFTLLFEAFAIKLIMSVKEAARLLDEKENRLWRALNHYVEKEIEQQDFEKEPIINLAIDEVSMRKGHIYVTNFLDIDTKKVIYVAPGKGSNTLTLFKKAYLPAGRQVWKKVEKLMIFKLL